jgi:hypothetical protein
MTPDATMITPAQRTLFRDIDDETKNLAELFDSRAEPDDPGAELARATAIRSATRRLREKWEALDRLLESEPGK